MTSVRFIAHWPGSEDDKASSGYSEPGWYFWDETWGYCYGPYASICVKRRGRCRTTSLREGAVMIELSWKFLRSANVARCRDSFKVCADWSVGDWGNAIAGEVGELCNLLKKVRRREPIDTRKIADELADVIIYADLIAHEFGIDLAAAVVRKFNEVSGRVGSNHRLFATPEAILPLSDEERKKLIDAARGGLS